MPEPIRIIAWGNRGRSDDGVALVLAERLAARFAGDPGVEVQQYHQLGPEVADDLGRCRLAVFLDAHVREDWDDVVVEPVRPSAGAAVFAHHFPPPLLLALARSINLRVPPAWLVSIRGRCFEFGDGLSERTAGGLARAEQRVLELVADARRNGRQEGSSHA
ncbi:MAG: hydrogenase maturation protease [Phycisphaerae bacterium]|jgi:hydrogenase maturation protease